MPGAWRLEDDSGDITLEDLTDYYENTEAYFWAPAWWDGADRQTMTERGWWNGSSEQPVTLLGFRTAIGIDPIQQ